MATINKIKCDTDCCENHPEFLVKDMFDQNVGRFCIICSYEWLYFLNKDEKIDCAVFDR